MAPCRHTGSLEGRWAQNLAAQLQHPAQGGSRPWGPLTCQPPTFSQAGPCNLRILSTGQELSRGTQQYSGLAETSVGSPIYLFNLTFLLNFGGAFPGGVVLKNPPANAEDLGSIRGSGRSPGGGNGSSTPVFLPRESHGQRSPWGHKESGMTE